MTGPLIREVEMFPFDQANQPIYQQYAQAYDSGQSGNLDHGQMLDHVTQFMQNAPPSMQQGILGQVFSQMGVQQRPDLIGQLLGPGGMMSSPLAQMALSGIAGLAAKQMMGQAAPNHA